MSVYTMANVWENSQMKGSALLLLLAIADNADEYGLGWPGVEYLAKKTRLSVRQVIRLIKIIETSSELIVIQDKKYNRYIVNVIPTYREKDGYGHGRCRICGAQKYRKIDGKLVERDLHDHHIWPIEKGGPKNGKTIEVCQECHTRIHQKMKELNLSTSSDILSRDILYPLGDIQGESSDITMSQNPSLEPSIEPSFQQKEILKTEEQAIVDSLDKDHPQTAGNFTPITEDNFHDRISGAIEESYARQNGKDAAIESFLGKLPEGHRPIARAFMERFGRAPLKNEEKFWRSQFAVIYELGIKPEYIGKAFAKLEVGGLPITSPKSVRGTAESIQRTAITASNITDDYERLCEMYEPAGYSSMRGLDGKIAWMKGFTKEQVEQWNLDHP